MVKQVPGQAQAPSTEPHEGASFRVLIAIGEPLFRDALRSALADRPEVEVILDAANAGEALHRATMAAPNVAFLSASLPPGDVVETVSALTRSAPWCRSIVVSDEEDSGLLQRAIESGAAGYMTTRAGVDDLMEAVRRVGAGEVVVPPRMLGGLVRGLLVWRGELTSAWQTLLTLSLREREILHHLVEGHDNTTIAQALSISRQTVRTHIQRVLGKLGVHSRLEAAAFVRMNGLTEELLVDGAMTSVPQRGIVGGMSVHPREGVV